MSFYHDNVHVIYSNRHIDSRGMFEELYNADAQISIDKFTSTTQLGNINNKFPNGVRQISRATSFKNVFRGFHFQPGMYKVLRIIQGSMNLHFMDMRPNSKSFGKIENMLYSTKQTEMMFLVNDFVGVGYYTNENDTILEYFHSDTFKPEKSYAVKGFPAFGWAEYATTSERDKNAMSVDEWKTYALDNGIFV